MMDEHTGKYNVQLVSGGQTIGQQQIIYTEQSDTNPVVSKPMTSSVVMTSSLSPHQSSSSQLRDPSQLRDQVSLIQTVSVPPTSQSPDRMTSQWWMTSSLLRYCYVKSSSRIPLSVLNFWLPDFLYITVFQSSETDCSFTVIYFNIFSWVKFFFKLQF